MDLWINLNLFWAEFQGQNFKSIEIYIFIFFDYANEFILFSILGAEKAVSAPTGVSL